MCHIASGGNISTLPLLPECCRQMECVKRFETPLPSMQVDQLECLIEILGDDRFHHEITSFDRGEELVEQ